MDFFARKEEMEDDTEIFISPVASSQDKHDKDAEEEVVNH